MATVQSNLLRLALRVDAKEPDGTELTLSTIGQSGHDGEKFSGQRLLDIYNEARLALGAILIADIDNVNRWFRGLRIKFTTGTISVAAGVASISRPSDYVDLISLTNTTKKVPIIVLPQEYWSESEQGENPYIVPDANQSFMYAIDNKYQCTDENPSINTNAYRIVYQGLTNWVLNPDVQGGTQVETFEDIYIPALMDLAAAIANQMGNAEVIAVGKAALAQMQAAQ